MTTYNYLWRSALDKRTMPSIMERPKTVEDARNVLRGAIDDSPRFKGNVAALTWKLWRGLHGKDFIRDFLDGRKGKIGGAAETAAVERALNLAPGTLAIAVDELHPTAHDGDMLQIIEDAMTVVAYLIDPKHKWEDEQFDLAARFFQESLSDKQSFGEDRETRRLRLEIAIRRALQKENL